MGFINLAEKTISAKLVYYGVGMGGKTTSLQAVHKIMCPRNEVQLVSINTEEDSTLLFDFLPINLGQVEGFKIRIQGFTVPGQPKYKLMRKYVLSGADAVVFVVDSQESRIEENQQSLESLLNNLRLNGLDPQRIPIVLQYNKRDLADILSEEALDAQFKTSPGMASFPSVATESQGVFETFVHAAGLLVENKVKAYKLGKGEVDPAVVAEGARQKLWELFDSVRGEVSKKPLPRVALRMEEPGTLPTGLSILDAADAKTAPEPSPQSAVLSDEELLAPISTNADFATEPAAVDSGEEREGLLDKAVQSNVELARRFGELDQYKTLLEQKNRELVEVAQNTVHDLNKPIAAIRLMLSTVDKGYLGEIGANVRDAIKNGLDAVHLMERLIRDLLDSSRLDFDGIQFEFKELDMTLLIAQILRTLRYEIEEKDTRVRIEPMPMIRADEWALTKVFLNLIGNALQYAAPERDPLIQVSCTEEPERYVFCVRDNGIGIPEQDKARVFQRFQRGSNTCGISGTGLGLHIVKEMILGHGGQVWVESELGQGTSFYLGIPKEPVQAEFSMVSELAQKAEA